MISVDLKDVEKLERDLQLFARKSLPYAASSAANNMAFTARKTWVSEIESTMVLRNRYTLNSLRVEKASPRGTVESIQAVLGSLAPYMAEQESGAAHQIGNRTAIPTSAAAGQQGAKPRTKPVRAPNRLKAIALAPRSHKGPRKQRNAISMRLALAQGKRFVFLELAKGRGLFRITGAKRKPKVQMVWDFSRGSRPIPKNPTLGRTVSSIQGQGLTFYHEALIEQAKRARVLGY
ncbi:MAG TPA: hypothetical protein VFQ61_06640 [Polyangiaceae bacterium]|nr:hypothetical protein [Polyangiaceae bacterium]